MWMYCSIAANLGILGLFKYFNFFSQTAARIAEILGMDGTPLLLEIALPAGLSFYTFQSMAYTLDVYRGTIKPVRNFRDFALFVSFFPQLMAGPIERASKLLPQLLRERKITPEGIREGVWLFYWGCFKKLYIADSLIPMSSRVADPLDEKHYLLAVLAFSFRIYCDFSGYSDMAVGIAKMLGVRLTRNFRVPFLSSDPGEFWRRWHISLSTWFRDYVYGPMRDPIGRNMALLITMVLIGFWHGAAWQFILFGAAWGIVLVIHRNLAPHIATVAARGPFFLFVTKYGGIVLTFSIWLLIGILFISSDFNNAVEAWTTIFTDFTPTVSTWKSLALILFYSWPIIAMDIAMYVTGDQDCVRKLAYPWRLLIYTVMAFLLLSKGSYDAQEFIYFRF